MDFSVRFPEVYIESIISRNLANLEPWKPGWVHTSSASEWERFPARVRTTHPTWQEMRLDEAKTKLL